MQDYKNFKLIDTRELSDINSTAFLFEHEKTKAKVLKLSNDDENKVFSIAFKTIPQDSTGVAHIMEHSVLNGSKKYTTREPFMDLVKSSLQTFLNAITYPDKTCYPVASRNSKDFKISWTFIWMQYLIQLFTKRKIFSTKKDGITKSKMSMTISNTMV